jgi:selenocysteine lyase/cysteine desulfurase
MYGKYDLLKKLESINHYFIGKEEVPYKLQPGNFNFELTYSLGAIPEYFEALHDHHFSSETEIDSVKKHKKSFELIADHEEKIAYELLNYLSGKAEIKIIGELKADKNIRVPTISFVHNSMKSSAIVRKIDKFNIGIRYGDFYAKKIIEDFDLEKKDGVVRVSLVHYNTLEEVRNLINALETVL